jgi:hypothetical protein
MDTRPILKLWVETQDKLNLDVVWGSPFFWGPLVALAVFGLFTRRTRAVVVAVFVWLEWTLTHFTIIQTPEPTELAIFVVGTALLVTFTTIGWTKL